jgi:hypothetical protein
MKKIVLIAALTLMNSMVAQCPAAASFVIVKQSKKDPYSVNSNSRTASILSGNSYELSFIAQNGMDYRFSVACLNSGAGTVSYELYEMVTEKSESNGKTEYKKIKKSIGTSADAEGGVLEMVSDKTRKIFIKVTLDGGNPKKPECVGVLIENKFSTKIGF